MPLPRGDEYQIAVQTPQYSFSDSELKACTVEKTPLDLPKPYAGGFTTTYHLQQNRQNWAVRCFTREVSDLVTRYRAIGHFIQHNPCPYFVDATCLEEGIRLNNQWYPVIKMRWIDGVPLNLFIEGNLTHPPRLKQLGERFVDLVRHLEKLGMAHGDLQHGNILVKDGKLFLIDYDGMFLPELARLRSSEIGHVNYQHPARGEQHYNQDIDRFSTLVIYTALAAIAARPGLWRKYDDSENLLFRREDFTKPEASALLAELADIPSLQPLVERLKGACRLDIGKLPTLDTFITGSFTYPKVASQVRYSEAKSQYPVFSASNPQAVLEYIGARVEVVGRVVEIQPASTPRSSRLYLRLQDGQPVGSPFSLVLWSETLELFKKQGLDPQTFYGKWVSVTGVVIAYRQEPQLVVEIPSQIQVLKDEAEARRKLAPLSSTGGSLRPPIPNLNDQAPPVQEGTLSRQDKSILERLYGPAQSQPAPASRQPPPATNSGKLRAPASWRAFYPLIPGRSAQTRQRSIRSIAWSQKRRSAVKKTGNWLKRTSRRLAAWLRHPRSRPVTRLTLRRISLLIFYMTAALIALSAIYFLPSWLMSDRSANPTGQPSSKSAAAADSAVGTPAQIPTARGCASYDLNVRDKPSLNSYLLDWLQQDQCVLFNGRSKRLDWLHIADDQGVVSGWVEASNVQLEAEINQLPEIDK